VSAEIGTDPHVAIRMLIESYADAADRADGAAAAELFTPDGELELWFDPSASEPTGRRCGRAEIEAAIATLTRYYATHHTISSSVAEVTGTRAQSRTRCVAHHVEGDPPERDRVLYIEYLDTLEHSDGRWRFNRRELHVRWTAVQSVEARRGGRDD
jgi:ketosteroid isomerase-like protein